MNQQNKNKKTQELYNSLKNYRRDISTYQQLELIIKQKNQTKNKKNYNQNIIQYEQIQHTKKIKIIDQISQEQQFQNKSSYEQIQQPQSQILIQQSKRRKIINGQKANNSLIKQEFVAQSQQEFDTQRLIQQSRRRKIITGQKILKQQKIKQQSDQSQRPFNFQTPKSKIINENLINTQKQMFFQNIPVYFPFEPYKIQKDYMAAVIKSLNYSYNALLQSPTGTGKTLCLICAVLSWVSQYKYKTNKKLYVIYSSRTHSQLQQVKSELQKTCFRPTICNIASRDHYCVNQKFSGLQGTCLVKACKKSVNSYFKAKRALEMDQEKQDYCEYYKTKSQSNQILIDNYKNKIINSEQIKKEGKMGKFCPYYYNVHIKQQADIIFMPYNYLFDPKISFQYKDVIQNSIIILDEAHNIPDAACGARSSSIKLLILQNAVKEIRKVQQKLEKAQKQFTKIQHLQCFYRQTCKQIKEQIKYFEQRLLLLADQTLQQLSLIKKIQSSHKQADDNLQKMFKPQHIKMIFYNWFGTKKYQWHQFQQLNIQQRLYINQKIIKYLKKIINNIDKIIKLLKQYFNQDYEYLQKFKRFLEKCQQLLESDDDNVQYWENQINHYRLLVKFKIVTQKLQFQASFICLTPSLTFKNLQRKNPRSIILTSGTLSPLDSWQKQLNIRFDVQLVNKHVINTNRQQTHLGIISKSFNQNFFNFGFNNLQNNTIIYKDLLKSIIQFSKFIPNGMLVIFPSYKIINKFKEQLQKNRYSYDQLKTNKSICFEDKQNHNAIINKFKNRAVTARGAILFCVFRGKLSEGIDFTDELCRAVIVVGVPFADMKDPLVKQKKQYYDELSKKSNNGCLNTLTGDSWYRLCAMRSVNQGIGRVIRHIDDYGIILMLDHRYSQQRLKSLLPSWAKQNMDSYDNFIRIIEKIKKFFGHSNKKQAQNMFWTTNILSKQQQQLIKNFRKIKKQDNYNNYSSRMINQNIRNKKQLKKQKKQQKEQEEF